MNNNIRIVRETCVMSGGTFVYLIRSELIKELIAFVQTDSK